MSVSIYKPSGVKVEVLSVHDEGEYLMVRSNTNGRVFYAHKDQIGSGETEQQPVQVNKTTPNRRGRRQLAVVQPQAPVDTRINLNNLTAEGLTQALPGVGLKTAKEIIELKQSLPGERFTKLDQLKSIKRVDWDEVFETGSVYVE